MAYDVETMINRHIVPEMGYQLLKDLTADDLGHFIGVLRERPGIRGRKMGPERINKILKLLKRSLQGAVEMDCLHRSPMSGWKALRTSKPDMRPFSRHEFRTFLEALPIRWKPYFEFATWTGLRPGEQAALQWSDVDLQRVPPVIEIRAPLDPRKSGLRRPPKTFESAGTVELIPPALAALKMQQTFGSSNSDWVFHGAKGGPVNISNITRRVYYPAIKRAGLVERPLYNLRHCFAVFMLDAGENPGWVAKQMRHTSVEMLWRRYARWWPNVARSDGSRVEQWWRD
jgi:integrase